MLFIQGLPQCLTDCRDFLKRQVFLPCKALQETLVQIKIIVSYNRKNQNKISFFQVKYTNIILKRIRISKVIMAGNTIRKE